MRLHNAVFILYLIPHRPTSHSDSCCQYRQPGEPPGANGGSIDIQLHPDSPEWIPGCRTLIMQSLTPGCSATLVATIIETIEKTIPDGSIIRQQGRGT